MKDDPDRTEKMKQESRSLQVQKLRINWDAMGEMANAERALAAGTIQDLMDEVEAWQQAMQKADRDIMELRKERDTVRRTFCFIIASGNFNARDGNTAHRSGAEWVAELNGWDCFKETA